MWRHGELHPYATCGMMSRKNAQVIQHRYKTTGIIGRFANTISTVGFHSGRCLGAHLQMCELKLSLGLVVRIFVHLSSNSEMNMFIYNYILHIIYQAVMYFTLLSKCLSVEMTVQWHQLFTLHLILTPRSLSFRTVLVVWGGGVNPPSERV